MDDATKTALITGASGGIGAALARRLAGGGWSVVLCARRLEALEAVARSLPDGRGRVEPLDVSDGDAAAATVRRVDDEVGGLDLVVANAGVAGMRWGGELTWEDCPRMLAVNVTGALATLTAVTPRMVERGRGHLVGISSMAAYRGLPHNALYSASKAFVSTLLESLRVDLAGTGVAVTDVRPGFVRTAMTDALDSPMPFMVEPDDAAARIAEGIDRREAVVAFPWTMATLVRSMRLLPSAVYGRAARAVRPPGSARQGE
ncbi:MAG TPA: SDR family NAD(P)-dependent oxidoreductase [Sandaracinaceae bacterium LLY-WYZ-13_1]|nr:SDR family NAD(P)-dependent oxidoreductase [Sandaracinaceae bacterium LLY-WYZ-13_1]